MTLTEEGYERTASLLGALGFELVGEERDRFRYEVGDGGPGALVDVKCQPTLAPGIVDVGTVHHVAWRTPDEEQQREWRHEMVKARDERDPNN